VRKKRRTRQHIIADLSLNHVERYALRAGFTVQPIAQDYGIDLVLTTYDDDGQVETGHVMLQVKATDHLRVLADGDTVALRLQRADLELWLTDPSPVIVVIYHAQGDMAYWVYLQAYFEERSTFDLSRAGQTVTVYVPLSDRVDESAFRRFARFRDEVLALQRRSIRHDA